MKLALKFIVNFVIYIAIVAVIIWGLPTLLARGLDTPYPIAAITSGSMWPVLKTGDMVLIHGVKKEDLQLGDIIVWNNAEGGFTIHRIVKLDPDMLTTKGDANFDPDRPIPYTDVVGRLFTIAGRNVRIPYLGYISINFGKYVKQAVKL